MAKAKAKKSAGASTVYRIKVTLDSSKPPIWRRLEVSSDMTLADLHDVLQVAMGWGNCHLHMFTIGGENYGRPHPDDFQDVIDERGVKLADVIGGEKFKFRYEYDFGDSWNHTLLVEKILPADPADHYPSCVKGKRNCPPDDVGGIWGYDSYLEIMANPGHPEHKEMVEWSGGEFDPEEFEIETINAQLRRFG